MGTSPLGGKAKSITVSAVIKRADGTTENLGNVGYFSNNPLKNLWWKIKRLFHKGF